MNKKYIGELDFLKFIMCLVILILHVDERFVAEPCHFKNGGFAVEFFFAISGYFMCVSAVKASERNRENKLGLETIQFVFHKLKAIVFPYIVSFILNFIVWYEKKGNVIWGEEGPRVFANSIINKIPNFLLLSMSGNLSDIVISRISWYISAMLLAMLILYPILRKYGQNFRLIGAPIICLFLTGYLYNQCSRYKGIEDYVLIMPQGMWRAIIGLCLGCIIYEASEWLNKLTLTKFARICLSIWNVIMLGSIFYMYCYSDRNAGYVFNYFVFFLLVVVTSKQNICGQFFDNKYSKFLGRLSMYIYLLHIPVANQICFDHPNWNFEKALLIIMTDTGIVTMMVMLFEKLNKNFQWGIKLKNLFIRDSKLDTGERI